MSASGRKRTVCFRTATRESGRSARLYALRKPGSVGRPAIGDMVKLFEGVDPNPANPTAVRLLHCASLTCEVPNGGGGKLGTRLFADRRHLIAPVELSSANRAMRWIADVERTRIAHSLSTTKGKAWSRHRAIGKRCFGGMPAGKVQAARLRSLGS